MLYGASGRYGGRMTSRDLPDAADLQQLPADIRNACAAVWWEHAGAEGRVASAFEVVSAALKRLNADPGIIKTAERAVDDEHRHRALCEAVSAAFATRHLGPSSRIEITVPAHEGATPEERDALHVVGQCCFNETFAGAYLMAALDGASNEYARAALRELLSDEIDHARVGWAFVQTASPEIRTCISSWLVRMTVANLREWLRLGYREDATLEPYGLPRRARVEAALLDALDGVVVPGFRHVGLDVAELSRLAAALRTEGPSGLAKIRALD